MKSGKNEDCCLPAQIEHLPADLKEIPAKTAEIPAKLTNLPAEQILKKARRAYTLLASAFLLTYTLHISLNLRTQHE